MRTIIFLCLLVSAFSSDPFIWPLPKEYHHGSITVPVNSKHFSFHGPGSKDLTAAYDRMIKLYFDKIVPEPVTKSIQGVEVSVVDLHAELKLNVDESYTLIVPKDTSNIQISAQTIFGVYNALQTLSQLIIYDFDMDSYVIENCPWVIEDSPRFTHRAIMLDTARHYQPVATIKKILESMTYAKLNVFHWHITDTQSTPAYVSAYPNMWNGAYSQYERYTIEDIRDVVEFARKLGIRVMPELDLPGHEESWCKGVPEVCPSQECKDPLDPSTPVTWDLIDQIFKEWTGAASGKPVFGDELYHFGGDEVGTWCWSNTPRISAWMKSMNFTAHETYRYFVLRVFENLQKYNRVGVVWEEVWLGFGKALNPNTVIETWMEKKTMKSIVEAGYRTIISDPYLYLDNIWYPWEDVYNDEPMAFAEDKYEKFVLGGEACMWGETADTGDVHQTIWPKAAAFAERFWSPRSVNDVKKAEVRYQYFRCLLNKRGVQAAPALNKQGRDPPVGPGSCYAQ